MWTHAAISVRFLYFKPKTFNKAEQEKGILYQNKSHARVVTSYKSEQVIST